MCGQECSATELWLTSALNPPVCKRTQEPAQQPLLPLLCSITIPDNNILSLLNSHLTHRAKQLHHLYTVWLVTASGTQSVNRGVIWWTNMRLTVIILTVNYHMSGLHNLLLKTILRKRKKIYFYYKKVRIQKLHIHLYQSECDYVCEPNVRLKT